MAEPISAAYMHWPHSTFTLSRLRYTGAPLLGTLILGTHYIVSCDAESVRGREGVEQDDTGMYALSCLFRPAVFC